jgi:hypothetical protein
LVNGDWRLDLAIEDLGLKRMNMKVLIRAVMIGAVACAVPVAAQQRQATASRSAAEIQARHEISVLEGVLENAVRYGTQMLNQHLQTANMPDMVLLTGMVRSRGFRLDGYGVVFDVEFPSLRQSVMWGMRALSQADPDLAKAMEEMRRNLQSVVDPQARKEMQRALELFEAQIRNFDAHAKAMAAPPAGGVSAASNSTAALRPVEMTPAVSDPRALYLSEITNALTNAILDHGAPVGVGLEEWLTVAARESADRRFVPHDPNDTVMTLVLRIKGSDLHALRDRRLTRDEARKRVDVKQY